VKELDRFVLLIKIFNSASLTDDEHLEHYISIEPAVWISKLPGDFLEVGASIEKVMCVWMEDRKDRCFFH
jgi:hypothetical protein